MKWVFLILVAVNAVYFVVANLLISSEAQKQTTQQLEIISSQTQVEETKDNRCLFVKASDKDMDTMFKKLRSVEVKVDKWTFSQVFSRKFWVITGPHASQAAAKAELDDMKSKGVADAFIITSGQFNNAISLGVFGSSNNANRMKNSAAAKGVNARVEEVRDEETDTWLRIQPQDVYVVESTWLPKFKIDYKIENSRKYDCQRVAMP